jgi:calcineurin-like phosphoesterase family protein
MPDMFFVSDTHFGHKAVLQFESKARPFDTIEQHDEQIITNWNSVVTKRDVVIHLGDVIFSGSANFKNILGRLNGIKRLVAGNHDTKRIHQLAPYFTSICGVMSFEKYSLTHIPIHTSQFYRFKGNIHGHLHSDTVKRFLWFDDPRYINVSLEQINLTPISWDNLKLRIP